MPTNPKPPQAGSYRGKLPSIRQEIDAPELRREAWQTREPTLLGIAPPAPGAVQPSEWRDDEPDTNLRVIHAQASELAAQARRIAELERQPPRVESEAVELGFRARGIKWARVWTAVSLLLGVGGTALGVRSVAVTPPVQQPVAPVAATAGELETRVGRLEACLAEVRKFDLENDAFTEKVAKLAGVELPRRATDPPPQEIVVEAQPLVNPHPGQKPLLKITSTRPARPQCNGGR